MRSTEVAVTVATRHRSTVVRFNFCFYCRAHTWRVASSKPSCWLRCVRDAMRESRSWTIMYTENIDVRRHSVWSRLRDPIWTHSYIYPRDCADASDENSNYCRKILHFSCTMTPKTTFPTSSRQLQCGWNSMFEFHGWPSMRAEIIHMRWRSVISSSFE